MRIEVQYYETAGYGSGDSNAQAIIMPVMAVGTSSGTIYLQNVSTLQASSRRFLLVVRNMDHCKQPHVGKGGKSFPPHKRKQSACFDSSSVVFCMQVYARLTGGHKAAVTQLQVLGSKIKNNHDLLLSAAQFKARMCELTVPA